MTPNPGSSGSARWNILAAWAHVAGTGGTEAEAETLRLRTARQHRRAARLRPRGDHGLLEGTGDVLLSYENEAILAKQSGEDFDYVVPDDTLLIENPARVTEDAEDGAQDFLDFRVSAEGQELYAELGFRPGRRRRRCRAPEVEGANDPADPFPAPRAAVTIDGDFGGWAEAADKFFATARTASRWHHPEAHRGRRHGRPGVTSCGYRRLLDAPAPARRRQRRRAGARSTLTAGSALGLGVAVIWFSLLVLIPLSAIVGDGRRGRLVRLLRHAHQPADHGCAPAHRRSSLIVTAINIVMGTLIAWVLVRDRFWGKAMLDVIIDIPFALPTIVAGLVLLALYGHEQPDRRRLGLHREGGAARAGLRDAAVHRPHRAAGARGARARRRGGRGVAGRQPVHDLPPGHPAVPGAGDLRRRRAVLRPGIAEYGSLVLLSGNKPF